MVMRTYGLSGSGMDVDQMVKDLMKARRASYDKVWQQKTQLEWKKQDYNTVYSLTEDLRNNTLFDFRKQSNLIPKQVTSSNDSVVSATANGDAANVSHSVVVNQLADGVKLSSSGSITDTAAGKSNDTLAKQFGYDPATNPTLSLSINGKKVDINITDKTTIYDVVSKINNSGANVKANYDSTLDRFYFYSNKTGASASVDFTGSDAAGLDFIMNKLKINSVTDKGMQSTGSLGLSNADYIGASLNSRFGITGTFSINVTTNSGTMNIPVDSSTNTLSDVLAAINSKVGSEVAKYDAATGKVSINAGAGSTFSISSDSDTGNDFLINKLKLANYGQNAKVNIDGVDLEQASNSFQVSGVSYNLKTVSAIDPNDTTKRVSTAVNVQADIEKTISNVQAFVDTYNTFLKAINTELNETKYRDFPPLTDEQKSSMKDSDIKAWEEKAKSGSLRRDSILSQLASSMRLDFANSIKGLNGKYKCAADIGIGTAKYFDDDGDLTTAVTNGGKIQVNEDDLRKALEEDPDVVYKIFGSPGDSTESQGVATRLYNQMYETMKSIQDVAGLPDTTDTTSSLAKQLDDFDDRLDEMNDRLQQMEDRYYKQFDAMETALSKLTQQSSWLGQQFSS